MRRPIHYAPLVVVAALLSACGSSGTPGAGRPGAAPAHADSRGPAPRSGEGADPDMVAAVSANGTGPPIAMKFRLQDKPTVGRPAQLVIALYAAPGIDIGHVHGSLQPQDGLQLQSERSFDIDALREGTPVQQQVTVVPQREGVLSLSASVVVDYENSSLARTYIIPLIAVDNAS